MDHLSSFFVLYSALVLIWLKRLLPMKKVLAFLFFTAVVMLFLPPDYIGSDDMGLEPIFNRWIVFKVFAGLFFAFVSIKAGHKFVGLLFGGVLYLFVLFYYCGFHMDFNLDFKPFFKMFFMLLFSFYFFVYLLVIEFIPFVIFVKPVFGLSKYGEIQISLREFKIFLVYIAGFVLLVFALYNISFGSANYYLSRCQLIEYRGGGSCYSCRDDYAGYVSHNIYRLVLQDDTNERLKAYLKIFEHDMRQGLCILYFYEDPYVFRDSGPYLHCPPSFGVDHGNIVGDFEFAVDVVDGKCSSVLDYGEDIFSFEKTDNAQNCYKAPFEEVNMTLLSNFQKKCVDFASEGEYVLSDTSGIEKLRVVVYKGGRYDVLLK